MRANLAITRWLALAALAACNLRLSTAFAQSCSCTNWNSLTNLTQTTAPNGAWFSVASSTDGTKLVAVVDGGGIYTSTNSGVAWSLTSAPTNAVWQCVASSADGTKLVAVMGDGGIYTSTNSGAAWSLTSAPFGVWMSVASSADGSKLAAVWNDYNGTMYVAGVYTSTNSGAAWSLTSTPTNEDWFSVASSADGTKLVVLGGAPTSSGGIQGIYTSTNSGATWTQTSASGEYWWSVASSADGTKLVAVTWPGGIYTSTNSGSTWTQTSAPSAPWWSVASSADGTKLAAVVVSGGEIQISTNSGATWMQASAPGVGAWDTIAFSADGTKLAAAQPYGGIWTAQATISPSITSQPASATVSTGGSVTFSAGVSGTPPFAYQWSFDGTAIDEATNAMLTITNIGSTNVGSYTLTVSNSAGGVTSQAAALASMDIQMFGMFAGVIVNGPPGSNYLIQATFSLSSGWTTLTNVALPTQPYILIDYNSPSNSQQFYRAVPQ